MHSTHRSTTGKLGELAELLEQLIDERIDARLAKVPQSMTSSTQLVDLAKIGVPKRTTYRAARAGEFEGATKIDRRWYATPAAVEKWIASHAPKAELVEPKAPDEASSNLQRLRKKFGLKLVAGAK